MSCNKAYLVLIIAGFTIVETSTKKYAINGTIVCPTEGRFKDPRDCTSYFDCVPNKSGGQLKHIKRSCVNGGFNGKKCVSFKKLKNCMPREGRRLQASFNKELNYLCERDHSRREFCSDCLHQIHCIEGQAHAHECEGGSYCREDKSSFHNSAVCYPEKFDECMCPDDNHFYKQDPYRDIAFLHCDENGLTAVLECLQGQTFDVKQQKCVLDPDSPPVCHKSGKFVNSKDCTKYYSCVNTRTGWVQKEFQCVEEKTFFNELIQNCGNPCSAFDGGESVCHNKEGRFGNPIDCSQYYECFVQQPDGKRSTLRDCPKGYNWLADTEKPNTGNCIPQAFSKCTLSKSLTCNIPEGWCDSSIKIEISVDGKENKIPAKNEISEVSENSIVKEISKVTEVTEIHEETKEIEIHEETEDIEVTVDTEDKKNIKEEEDNTNIKETEDIEVTVDTEDNKNIKAEEDNKNIKETENIEVTVDTEDNKNIKEEEDNKNIKETEDIEVTVDTEDNKNMKETEDVEGTKIEEAASEDTEIKEENGDNQQFTQRRRLRLLSMF